MNYIRHLNAFFLMVRSDKRLACSHVSLYLALFQHWNYNRFNNPFPVYRESLMDLSRIGSKNTYHKCIKELHEARYISYHPSPSRFSPVKISIPRLDIEAEPISKFRQLEMFDKESKVASLHFMGDLEGQSGTIINTDSVPQSVSPSLQIDTGRVLNMGHSIKETFKKNKTVYNTPTPNNQNFNERNANVSPRVAKSRPHKFKPMAHPELMEVEFFFREQGSSAEEANKFFLYNQSKGWMITDKAPVRNWQALAEKWLLNPSKAAPPQKDKDSTILQNFNAVYQSFLHGQKFFGQITETHFTELKLQMTDDLLQNAWQERHRQLTGSNDHKTLQLLQAYETGNQQDPLIQADWANLVTLAKRIAVAKHFFQLKQSGATTIPP